MCLPSSSQYAARRCYTFATRHTNSTAQPTSRFALIIVPLGFGQCTVRMNASSRTRRAATARIRTLFLSLTLGGFVVADSTRAQIGRPLSAPSRASRASHQSSSSRPHNATSSRCYAAAMLNAGEAQNVLRLLRLPSSVGGGSAWCGRERVRVRRTCVYVRVDCVWQRITCLISNQHHIPSCGRCECE